jgi:hypothetical protein
VKILNVAGPRASKEPGVGEFVTEVLSRAFGGNINQDQVRGILSGW